MPSASGWRTCSRPSPWPVTPSRLGKKFDELAAPGCAGAGGRRCGRRKRSSPSSNDLLQQEGFFDDPQQRLLIFTEFKDTLDYLVKKLTEWGFRSAPSTAA